MMSEGKDCPDSSHGELDEEVFYMKASKEYKQQREEEEQSRLCLCGEADGVL